MRDAATASRTSSVRAVEARRQAGSAATRSISAPGTASGAAWTQEWPGGSAVCEGEALAVAGKQQPDGPGAQPGANHLVDGDAHAARVDQDELEVALPAPAEPSAGRVHDLADAHPPAPRHAVRINTRQQRAHCGHGGAADPGLPSNA